MAPPDSSSKSSPGSSPELASFASPPTLKDTPDAKKKKRIFGLDAYDSSNDDDDAIKGPAVSKKTRRSYGILADDSPTDDDDDKKPAAITQEDGDPTDDDDDGKNLATDDVGAAASTQRRATASTQRRGGGRGGFGVGGHGGGRGGGSGGSDSGSGNTGATGPRIRQPNLIPGDWRDRRTPPDEPWYPVEDEVRNKKNQRPAGLSLPSSKPGLTLKYGNRIAYCRKFIVEEGRDTGLPDVELPTVKKTVLQVFVLFLEMVHWYVISVPPEEITSTAVLYGRQSKPARHVSESKKNILAEVMKRLVFGIDCVDVTLFDAINNHTMPAVERCVDLLCDLVTKKLENEQYFITFTSDQLKQSSWEHTCKNLAERAKNGVWSSAFLLDKKRKKKLNRQSFHYTKGVYFPVAIMMEKLSLKFPKSVAKHLWYCTRRQVVGRKATSGRAWPSIKDSLTEEILHCEEETDEGPENNTEWKFRDVCDA